MTYYLLPHRFRWVLLIVASVAYYLSFIPVFFIVIASLTIGNYFLAYWLKGAVEKGNGKRALIFIIVINLLILALFKYFSFLFPSVKVTLWFVNWFYNVDPVMRMIIPIGLSYLIFTVLSYQIEIKRGNLLPENHFGYFTLYLLFFPKIAQGPIERPQKFLPQLRVLHTLDYGLVTEGLKRIVWGYFKKLVVADRLAIYVNTVYNNSENHNGTTLAIATVFFAIQIYADFSGYTDIAIGSAQLFGFRLSENFRRPYFATSIQDFWNRWHITFSTWLRDYIFLPLAYWFSRKMKHSRYLFLAAEKWIYLFSIMITFAICGLWHGEGLNYLVWGLLFGLYLTFANWTEKPFRQLRKRFHIRKTSNKYIVLQVFTTFCLVCVAWIFFRANDLKDALFIIKKIVSDVGTPFKDINVFIYGMLGSLILLYQELHDEFFQKKYRFLEHDNSIVSAFATSLLIVIILSIGVFDGSQFIYFQF